MRKTVLFLLLLVAALVIGFVFYRQSSQKSATDQATAGFPTAKGSAAPTNSTPSAATPSSNAAPSSPAAPTNTPTVYYEDKFARRGDLEGSLPEVKDTGDATWTLTTDQNSYSKADGGVTDSYNGYDAAYLPVNGTSGVPIDGMQNVQLSATIIPDSSGHWMGIGFNASPFLINQGHDVLNGGPAALTIANGHAEAYHNNDLVKTVTLPPATAKAYVISLTYRAADHTITYWIDGQPIATINNIPPDKMAALVAVSMGNGAGGPTSKITNFKLTVGGSD